MALTTVVCPVCHRAFVVNGRGRCTCGAYLVASWHGMNKGRRLFLPDGPVFVCGDDGLWSEHKKAAD